jgi:hypothetical protein
MKQFSPIAQLFKLFALTWCFHIINHDPSPWAHRSVETLKASNHHGCHRNQKRGWRGGLIPWFERVRHSGLPPVAFAFGDHW